MAILNLESRQFEEWRQTVKECGGDFVGVQSPLFSDPWQEHNVIFTRAGSTTLLSIPVSEFTQQAVMEKLGKKATSVHLVESGIKKLLDEIRLHLGNWTYLADKLEEELKKNG